uniref:Uncharacterized protein n=1 Tax=Rhizophora mucronata TaxID=61149 RepID=A0A2P2QJG4_RHIMU
MLTHKTRIQVTVQLILIQKH